MARGTMPVEAQPPQGFQPVVLQKMRGAAQKSLTLRAGLPTILASKAVPEAWAQLKLLKGQRGSFGRQPSLAPLHEAYAHGVLLL